MATDLERLTVTLEANLNRLQKQMASAGQIVDRETKKAAVAANRNLKTIEDRSEQAAANVNRSLSKAGQGASQLGTRMQQAGYQIGDFAVQVAGGQSALLALTQQGSQVLGAFGPWGAVIGAAGAVLGVLLTKLDLFGGTATLTADQMAALNSALDSNKEATAAAAQGYDALIAKLANFTELQKAAFVVQQKTTLGAELKELEEQIATTAGTLKSSIGDIRSQVLTMFGGKMDESFRDFYGRFDELQRLLESGKLPVERYAEFRSMLEYIASKSAPDLKAALQGVLDQLATTGAKAENYNEKQKTTQAVIDTVNGAIDANNRALIDQAARLGQAGDAADGYAKSMRDAADANVGLSFGDRSGRAGFAQLPKPDAVGSLIPDRPGTLGQTFPGARPADLETDKQAQDILDALAGQLGNSGKLKTTKPKAPKKTAAEKADEKADSHLASLQSEIDLNTKLLAAYALGEEAMAKIKAQYDAVNSARQIGLKEGTAEYSEYLSKAQAAEAENAALEAKLKLMAQGKSLTTELRTEQEQLNAKLVEYKALLDAGAISQTTYERAVAKAKDQNNGYAEGIQAIGDAIEGGIQGATSFNDALIKIGLSLAKLVLQAALFGETAGGGPLGKIFSSLTGLASGIVGSFGGSGGYDGGSGVGPIGPGGIAGHAASGGPVGPGLVKVGEGGPELLSLSRRGHVTPANATRRLTGGAGGASGPVEIYVSGARGNAEIEAMVTAGVARGVKASRATVGPDYENYRIRFGGRGR